MAQGRARGIFPGPMNVALLALELVSPSRRLPVDSLRCCCPSWWCCPEGPELVPGRSQVLANHIHNFTRHRAKLLRPSSVDVLQEPTDRAPREGPRIQPGVRRLHTVDQRQFAITIATLLRVGLQRRRGWRGLHCREVTPLCSLYRISGQSWASTHQHSNPKPLHLMSSAPVVAC